MAHKNQKIEKKRWYNPFSAKTLKSFKIGKISGYMRAVIPNPKDVFGIKKKDRMYYSPKGVLVTPEAYGSEKYEPDRVYYYEVGANDGSYRKCTTREDAETRFAQLIEFEKRQTQIR